MGMKSLPRAATHEWRALCGQFIVLWEAPGLNPGGTPFLDPPFGGDSLKKKGGARRLGLMLVTAYHPIPRLELGMYQLLGGVQIQQNTYHSVCFDKYKLPFVAIG